MTNIDLLDAFDPDEREQCPACEQQTLVGVADAPLFRVCLNCAAVWFEGLRKDDGHQLPVPADR